MEFVRVLLKMIVVMMKAIMAVASADGDYDVPSYYLVAILGWMIMKALPGGIWNYVVAILGWRLCIIVGTNKLDSVATYYFTLVYLRSPLEYFVPKNVLSSSHRSVFDSQNLSAPLFRNV